MNPNTEGQRATIRPHYTPVPTGRVPWIRIAACGATCRIGGDVCGTSRVEYVRCRECVRLMRAALRGAS